MIQKKHAVFAVGGLECMILLFRHASEVMAILTTLAQFVSCSGQKDAAWPAWLISDVQSELDIYLKW